MEFGEKLLKLSNSDILKKAIKEWEYEGNIEDDESCKSTCELCGKYGLRYNFEIVNNITMKNLWVGSECINKFNIEAIENGERLNSSDTAQKLKKDKRKFLNDKNKKYILNLLIKISVRDTEFKSDSFFKFYEKHNAFTPKQASMIVYLCKKYEIECNKNLIKISIRKEKYKKDLLEMDTFKLKQIEQCLSISQRKKVEYKL